MTPSPQFFESNMPNLRFLESIWRLSLCNLREFKDSKNFLTPLSYYISQNERKQDWNNEYWRYMHLF